MPKKTSIKKSARAKGQLRADQQEAARTVARMKKNGTPLTTKKAKAVVKKAVKKKVAKRKKRGGVFGIADKLRARGRL